MSVGAMSGANAAHAHAAANSGMASLQGPARNRLCSIAQLTKHSATRDSTPRTCVWPRPSSKGQADCLKLSRFSGDTGQMIQYAPATAPATKYAARVRNPHRRARSSAVCARLSDSAASSGP
jgi:hypothetical protein